MINGYLWIFMFKNCCLTGGVIWSYRGRDWWRGRCTLSSVGRLSCAFVRRRCRRAVGRWRWRGRRVARAAQRVWRGSGRGGRRRRRILAGNTPPVTISINIIITYALRHHLNCSVLLRLKMGGVFMQLLCKINSENFNLPSVVIGSTV